MEKVKTNELIRALICAASIHEEGEQLPCDSCPYYVKIPMSPEDIERGFPEDFDNYCDSEKAMLDAARRLSELNDVWISTCNRLPEAGKPVLVAREGGKVEQGIYLGVNGRWKVYGTNVKQVTHWMPMPLPPT